MIIRLEHANHNFPQKNLGDVIMEIPNLPADLSYDTLTFFRDTKTWSVWIVSHDRSYYGEGADVESAVKDAMTRFGAYDLASGRC